MALLINDSQRAAALEFAAQHPAQGLDPGFSARFFADQDALLNAKKCERARSATGRYPV